MGSSSIDLSLTNIWQCWYKFRKGKKVSKELDYFGYFLEKNLYRLYLDLNNGEYKHGGYHKFIVSDTKRREIAVAGIRDRIVHRLIYEYLVDIYDRIFIFDVWSCRKGRGLTGAILRAQKFLNSYPKSFIWRADIKKFFDNVEHKILKKILHRKIADDKILSLLNSVIDSYSTCGRLQGGIPIDNLTSQIFANIYLNEFDRFTKHILKPKAYLRYGDDFILMDLDYGRLAYFREKAASFLNENLNISINERSDIMVEAGQGLRFLGVEIFPRGRRLNKRNRTRVVARLNLRNISSYSGFLRQHENAKKVEIFDWRVLEIINSNL